MNGDITLRCSFCGQTQHEVGYLFGDAPSRDVFICDECVIEVYREIKRRRKANSATNAAKGEK